MKDLFGLIIARILYTIGIVPWWGKCLIGVFIGIIIGWSLA